MVKSLRGTKRASPKPPEEEADQCNIQKKKAKLDNPDVKSKYFDNDTGDSSKYSDTNMKDVLHLDEGIYNLSSESEESFVLQRKPKSLKIKDESDSESSSDEFMKAPISLDDLGDFETLKKEMLDSKDFEHKAGCISTVSKLSDDSDKNLETSDSREKEYYDFSQIIQSQELILKTRKEQENKCNQKKSPQKEVKNKSSKSPKKTKFSVKANFDEQLDVSEMLAMTEGPSLGSKRFSDSESEDENEEIKTEETYSVPKEGVQVTIEMPNAQQKRKSKGFDMEAAMKRRLNLIRKENQVLMHKVHTLCWLAHGIYLNRTINSENLIALALSLIPSKHCYPSKHADLNYLEQLVGWFINKITIAKDRKPSLNNSKQSLYDILEIAINARVALSQRDLVLIFVCMVRCLGIDARLVISLRSVPLRPPLSDLCTVSNKPKEEKRGSSIKQKEITTPLKKQKKTEKMQEKANSKSMPLEQSNVKPVKVSAVNKKSRCKSLSKPCLEVKSPYFSSSDELPLMVLKNKNSSGNVSVSLKTSKYKTSPSGGKERDKSIDNELNLKSPYFNSDIQSNTKSKANLEKKSAKKIENNSKTSPVKSETVSALVNRPSRNRKSAVASLCELMSSEDEVEIPKKVIASNQKKCSPKNRDNSKSLNKKDGKNFKKETMDEDDFQLPKATNSRKKPIDRRVLSSDDEKSTEKKIGNDYWAEVFLEAEEKWISVDLRKGKVHCIHQLYNGATQPVRYVIAWNNDGTMKDVTRRYAPQWLTVTRRQRTDEAWWRETLAPFTPHKTQRDREEDEDLDRQMHDKPLPSSITEYKNHPLFALQRHLLKFEAIYPPDAPPIGFVRSEPVYSRGCVVDLHTRETWIKEAKLVRRDEEPYKIVKARPKWDKLSGRVINDLPLPLFGHWQVEDYIPPPAVDGKVPRNEYGNVELYKPCMLPSGTVHLQVPQLARVARKLNIDCAPAVVGWEFSGGGSHPVLDGFIVCEEFKEILLDAWDKEMDESAKRAKEKVEQRVYGNWKRLIKGLLIRERLKLRYDFGAPESDKKVKKKQQPKPSTSKS